MQGSQFELSYAVCQGIACHDGTFFYIFSSCTSILLESQTDNGVDKLKKAKVDREADQESAQRNTTAGQLYSFGAEGRASRCPRYRNQDLPSALTVGGMWAKDIIPALLLWAGSLADPWTISDDELMQTLRIIILAIAPGFEDLNDIRPGTAIFNTVLLVLFTLLFDSCFLGQAYQRLCQWRSNFGSTAITLITHFLVSDKKNWRALLARSRGSVLSCWKILSFYI